MAICSIHNVRMAGLAAAVPPVRKVEWQELEIPTEHFKRARSFNRMPSVRAARWEQCQSDFCERAAKQLLDELGWAPASVDVIVMVTMTPDYPIPATGIIMQDRLGLPKACVAFDLPGGGVTLLHGIQVVASMLSSGCLRRGLLLFGEVSKVVEGPDSIENFEHICGHNGGALAFEHSPGGKPMSFSTGGDGTLEAAYQMPVGGTRRPPRPEMFATKVSIIRRRNSSWIFASVTRQPFGSCRRQPARLWRKPESAWRISTTVFFNRWTSRRRMRCERNWAFARIVFMGSLTNMGPADPVGFH